MQFIAPLRITNPTPIALSAVHITPEEYLERERAATDAKHEYFAGEMFALAGGSVRHAQIITRIARLLGNQLEGKDCDVVTGDVRVRVNETGLYTYPDVVAWCNEPAFPDDARDTLLNPTLLVEVTSPSTADYDRSRKFEHYRTIPTLQDYLVVAQGVMHVEHYTRQAENRWLLTDFRAPDDEIVLQGVPALLRLADLYERISFDA